MAYARHHPDPDANAALFEVISRRYLIPQALYDDPANSIADIYRTLRISRATLYRYKGRR